jgi:hypothetical protein
LPQKEREEGGGGGEGRERERDLEEDARLSLSLWSASLKDTGGDVIDVGLAALEWSDRQLHTIQEFVGADHELSFLLSSGE